MLKLYISEVLVILSLLSASAIITHFTSFSNTDGILLFTALCIIWYTHETRIMAKASVINQTHFTRPEVNLNVFANTNDPLDTRIRLMNPSNYQIAVSIDCGIQVSGSPISDFYPAYTGKEYWVISYRRGKEGHFSLLVVLLKAGVISNTEYYEIAKARQPFEKCLKVLNNKHNSLPTITMDVEIECENEMGISRRLFTQHYDYAFDRRIWIPKLTTSTKPDWKKLKNEKGV